MLDTVCVWVYIITMDTKRRQEYVWGNILRGRTLDFKKSDLRWWNEFKVRASGHPWERRIIPTMDRVETKLRLSDNASKGG